MYTWLPLGSVTCRSNIIVGAAAYLTDRAPMISNSGSGRRSARPEPRPGAMLMPAPPRPRSSSKKPDTACVHAGTTGDALPAGLDRPGERVAAVDRRDRVLGRVGQAIDDQPLDVGLQAPQDRVELDHPAPGCEVQLALGGAGRAGVEGDHAAGGGRVHEERQPDRNLKARPHVVGQLDVGQPLGAGAGRRGTRHRRSEAPSSSRTRTRSGAPPDAADGDGRPARWCRRCRTARRRRRESPRSPPGAPSARRVGAGRVRPRRPDTTSLRRRAATASATTPRRPGDGRASPGPPLLPPFSVTSPPPP